jgi:hypothetical protein
MGEQDAGRGTWRRRRRAVVLGLAAGLGLASGAEGQTLERSSPFAPRGAPAADQYSSAPATGSAASGAQAGAAAAQAGDARATPPSTPGDTGGRTRSRRAPESIVVAGAQDEQARATAPVADARGVTDADGDLPFTGSTPGLLVLAALALLAAGVALRAYGRRARVNPAGSRIRGLS